jgi:hypothetical protein
MVVCRLPYQFLELSKKHGSLANLSLQCPEPVVEGRRLDIERAFENNAGGNLIEMTNKMQICRKIY